MVQDVARRAEQVRDLKGQLAGLSPGDAAEIVFIDASPQRRRVTVYSMLNGEPIRIPAYMVEEVMQQTLPDGRFAFTSDQSKAPPYKLGDVKCFLHPDSPERPVLNEIGLAGAFCPAAHLANQYSKRMHAQHRHRRQWEAYQEYLGQQDRKKYEDRQDRQLEATLEIARAAANPSGRLGESVAPSGEHVCGCGKDYSHKKNPKQALRMHQRTCDASVSVSL